MADGHPDVEAHRRYRHWLPFEYRRRVLARRIAAALGHDAPL